MNALTSLFKTLTIDSKVTTKRVLVGYADTEGVPNRGDGKSSLWDMCIIFKHIVDATDYKVLDDCFHVCHVSLPKHQEKTTVKCNLKNHFDMIEHLKEKHSCDSICLCFWNAPHDNAVLRYYDITRFDTVDLLACARHYSDGKHESYSITNLCRKFNTLSNSSIHTGLGDTIRMMNILPLVGITSPEKMSVFVKHNSKYITSSNTKRDNEKISCRRGQTTTVEKIKDDRGINEFKCSARSRAVDKAMGR
jgi:hypothetical protein